MHHRFAEVPSDLSLLTGWNHRLICDEGNRNPMTVPELEARMRDWLTTGEYRAVIFFDDMRGTPLAYALYRESREEIHLRQFFVPRELRRQGIGRQAIALLREKLWPGTKRLTVEALVANTGAVAFWRAVGFRDYFISFEIMP